MTRLHNFSAGPATLPEEVLRQAADEMLDWRGSGMGVMEMSHRGKDYMSIHAQAEADLRELMAIPANYRILFMQGGAIAQNAIIPLNLMACGGNDPVADYVLTGSWSVKSAKEARKYGRVNIAASTEGAFSTVPAQSEWALSDNPAYVFTCTNETVMGVEFPFEPDLALVGKGDVPVVADMSSHILSRPMDVSRYGLIYAGAQKNIGPAGLAIVIVRDDLIGRAPAGTPAMLDYKVMADNGSMYNTPPTYSVYIAGLVFQWLKKLGGLKAMEEINRRKAGLLYDLIDGSGFYTNPVAKTDRSLMNIPFRMRDESLDESFLKSAKSAGLIQLKGHRSVGGMRASVYNAMPVEGVQALVDFMRDFEKKNG